MITHQMRLDAIRNAMIELRASAPCSKEQICSYVHFQTRGVTVANSDQLTDWLWDFLLKRKAIEPYADDIENAWVLTDKVSRD